MELWYLDNAYQREAAARVLSCQAAEKGLYRVALSGSIFAPEAGGQPRDGGTLGGAPLVDILTEEGETFFLIDQPLPQGSEAALCLDWERRFDHMQQHTGEHLLSGAAHALFGARNVGFHMAQDYATVDLDAPLTGEQLRRMEEEVNARIWRNLPVTVKTYPNQEALADVPLRKHAEGLAAPIRVVTIRDADACTCCAPHCAATGEVGLMLITDAIAYKGGVRLTFLCGGRAFRYARSAHEALDGIARSFSTARDNALSAVKKQAGELSHARRQNKELTAQLNGYLARELADAALNSGGTRIVCRLLKEVSPDRLVSLSQALCGDRKTACVLLSVQEDVLSYAVSVSQGVVPDAAELIQAVNAATGGKGGGRGTRAQGVSKQTGGAAETAEQLKTYLVNRFK